MPIHVVQVNETIDAIARQYGVSAQRLMQDNQIFDPTRLVVGQALLVLLPTRIHQVRENETLFTIARDYQVDVLTLVRNNPFVIEQQTLNTGDTIVIEYEGTKTRTVTTNGYVYPFVNFQVLEQVLPYLTTLCIFSYGFTVGGDLIPIDDEEIIEITRKNGVDPLLVLTPLDAEGRFNNNLVTAVAQSVAVQDKMIAELLQVVEAKNYAGVDVDFEYIRAEDGVGYANFVRKLREQMNARNYIVTVALAPKTSEDMPGLLYEGMNYRLLGEAANKALLMTYEWGYTYGPPMAVAPINKVQEVVDFAVTQIPPEKLDLGMANYAYDWALPFVRGTTAAEGIGHNEAIEIAYANNAQIQYDELAQSPFFTYTKDGVEHVVWFEDVRSIQQKFDLLKASNLDGFGYWQLMRYFRPNWLLLFSQFNIE